MTTTGTKRFQLRLHRHRRQVGAQSLEWLGLGAFVVALTGAAANAASGGLGGQMGQKLVDHISGLIGK